MSWFYYGKGDKDHHKKMNGVWVDIDHTNNTSIKELVDLIKKSKKKRFTETIMRAIIRDYDQHTDTVWVEIWCKSLIDSIRGINRYNVFYVVAQPNPNWVCHGDLGKGSNNV